MKLTIPFIYDMAVIKPRCRKASAALVRDSVEVEIAELTPHQAPVAFTLLSYDHENDCEGKTESIRWDGTQLWQRDYEIIARKEPRSVTAEEVKLHIDNAYADYGFSGPGASAPFFNLWRRLPYEERASSLLDRKCSGLPHVWLRDSEQYGNPVYDKVDDVPAREVIYSSRESVIALIMQVASQLRVIDGVMYTVGTEPRWCIYTFGLGHNNGGTSLSVDMHYNSNISHTRYFPANKKAEAIAAAEQIASNRGDTNYLPINLHGDDIVVLIPEAVCLNPSQEHGDGDPFINSIESQIEKSGSIVEAGAVAMGVLAASLQ